MTLIVFPQRYLMPHASLRPGAGSVYDSDAEAVFAAFSTPPDDTRKGHINTLVLALKAASAWNDFVFLYVHAAADSQAAKINWKSPGTLTATEVNSPTFTTDRGFTGNGSSSYVESGYNLSSGGGVYVQDSAHLGSYALTDVSANTSDLGVSSGLNAFLISRNGSSISFRINTGSTITKSTVATSVGHNVVTRTGSSLSRAFKNGSQIGTDDTTASAAPPNGTLRILSGASTFSSRQIAISHAGAGLSDAKVAALSSAFSTYLTAVGAI